MIFDRSAVGAASLVGARKGAGITQEQLADLAGLSVRTIRELEAGRVRQPRRGTLDLLVSALGLAGSEVGWFLSSWLEDHSASSSFELLTSGCDRQTLLAVQSTRGFTDVASVDRLEFGQDRRLVRRWVSIVMQAEQDDFTHRLVMFGHDDSDAFDRAQVRLMNASGCTSSRAVLGDDHGIAAFDLVFPRALAAGDTHLLTFEIAIDWDVQSGSRLIQDDNVLRAFHRPVAVAATQVAFVGCEAPARAWEVRRTRAREDQRVRELSVQGGAIDFLLRNAGPGVYGISWSW